VAVSAGVKHGHKTENSLIISFCLVAGLKYERGAYSTIASKSGLKTGALLNW
jgi:hypothetical protein